MLRRRSVHVVGIVASFTLVLAGSCGGRIAGGSSESDGGLGLGEGVVEDAGHVGPQKSDSGVFPPPNFDGGFSQGSSGSSGECPQTVTAADVPTYEQPDLAYGAGSCSTADINALSASVNNSNSTPDDWYKAISQLCQLCVFSGQSDPTWQIIVLSPDLKTGLAAGANAEGFLNVGPCFQEAPGGNAACGEGAENYENCVEAACPSPTCDSQQDCTNTATSGTCAGYNQEFTTGCGSAATALENYCYGNGSDTITALVQAVCGPTNDGGTALGGP